MPMSLQLSISQRRNGEPVLGAAVGAREEYACAIQRDGRIARSMPLSSSVQPSSRKQVSPQRTSALRIASANLCSD
jgi:hypothetical protein